MNVGLTDYDHALFMINRHNKELERIHATMCKIHGLTKANKFSTWMSVQQQVLSIVVASDGLPTWEETRKTLETIYGTEHKPTSGGYGAVYESETGLPPSISSPPCTHEFVHLGANRGFCKNCDINGTINSEGEVEWQV